MTVCPPPICPPASLPPRRPPAVARTSSNPGGPFREIVRQQWNFSKPRSTREIEDYRVELSDVTVLELTIVPNVSGGAARASLKSFRLS